ncbi:MAG TPA: hypothetical protein VM677_15720 [Actinokineospora sp.]|jgi:hypothetical protein|nr:hypothetical protein [Actinokineospora sp.]
MKSLATPSTLRISTARGCYSGRNLFGPNRHLVALLGTLYGAGSAALRGGIPTPRAIDFVDAQVDWRFGTFAQLGDAWPFDT